MGGGGLHKRESERKNDRRTVRFKPHRVEADWLTEDDCISVMITVLNLTARGSGRDVKTEAGIWVTIDLSYTHELHL